MIYSHFPVPIMMTVLENHDRYKNQFLPFIEDDSYFHKKEDWFACTETTLDHPKNKDLPWNEISNDIHEAVRFYLGVFQPKKDYRLSGESWLNRYYRNDYQETHTHVGNTNLVSVAYMLKIPKNSGKFSFINFENDFWHSTGATKIFDDCPRTSFIPEQEEGTLLIFPSNLKHLVTKNLSDNVRATISMNFSLIIGEPGQ